MGGVPTLGRPLPSPILNLRAGKDRGSLRQTCPAPPVLVGASLGASIAARFAIAHPDRVSRLVLVDAGSLGRFRPAPGVLLALVRFLARPSERTQQGGSSGRWR